MSHPVSHVDNDGAPLKPQPQPRQRRTFDLSSAPNSAPPTPPSGATAVMGDTITPLSTTSGDAKQASMEDESDTPARTRSFLNLTGSTLFGIYQDSRMGTETENTTPAGHGAQTPTYTSRNGSFDFTRSGVSSNTAFQRDANGKVTRVPAAPQVQKHRRPRKGFKGFVLPLIARVVTLFGMGVLYGILIGRLHDQRQIAPVRVDLDRTKWSYLATWGCIGALLGEALPWADELWASEDEDLEHRQARQQKKLRSLEAWMDVVRSIAVFIGIVFAIRRLPWESTLQLSLTLALANPALWYLIDRSPPGFILSTIVALSGTAVFLGTNPELVPSPSPWQLLQRSSGINSTLDAPNSEELVLGIFSQESVGLSTWIASVLFAPKTQCKPGPLTAIVAYLQRSKTCHSIKDLEKQLPGVASINGMQVKDYLQNLQDESRITVEKIGSGNWYWSFASQAKNEKAAALAEAQSSHGKASAAVQDLRIKLAEAAAANTDEAHGDISREELMAQQAVLEADVRALQKELAAYSDNDPTELERKKEQTMHLFEEAEKVTEDIQSMESWLAAQHGREVVKGVKEMYYGDEYDVEEESLREIVL